MYEDFTRIDLLTNKYNAVADDGNKSSLRREAAALFSLAQSQLPEATEVDGQPDEALANSNQALELFRKLGDKIGIADSLRLVMRSNRLMAEELKWIDEYSEKAKGLYESIDNMAKQHLDRARESGDKRMQAVMLLSIAENKYIKRGNQNRADAFEAAIAAAPMLKQMNDAKLEGLVNLILSRIYFKNHDVSAAIKSAHDGVVAYQAADDSSGEAECWYAIGAAHVQVHRVEEALEAGAKAVALSRECGNDDLRARICFVVARWYSMKSAFDRALPLIEEASDLLKGLRNPKGWLTSVLQIHVNALCGLGDAMAAVKLAKKEAKAFKKAGQKKHQVYALLCLARAYMHDFDDDAAEDSLEKAIEIAHGMQDKLLEIDAVKAAVAFYIKLERYDDALRMAEREKELNKELERPMEEAYTVMHSITKVHALAGDTTKGLNSADEALKLVENMGDATSEGCALLANSVVFTMNDEFEKALKSAEEAAEIFGENGDKAGQAKAYHHSSQLHLATNNFKAAMRFASDALDLQEALENKQQQSNVLLQMGSIHVANDRPKEAIPLFSDGARIARSADEPSKYTYLNLLEMAAAYGAIIEKSEQNAGTIAKENAALGAKAAKEAAKLAEGYDDMLNESKANYWIASHSLVVGKISDMFQAAFAAISLAKQGGSEFDRAKGMTMLAKAWIVKGKLARASGILEDAQAIAAKLDDPDLGVIISELLKETEVAAVVVASPVVQANTSAPTETTPAATETPTTSAAAVSRYVAPDPGLVAERIISMVLDMTGSTEAVEHDTPFMDSGIDSLASVELRTNLQQQFGVPLPSTVMFNFPTTSSITDFLVNEMAEREISLK